MLLKFNYSHHPHINFEEKKNLCLGFKIIDKLAVESKKLSIVCRENF